MTPINQEQIQSVPSMLQMVTGAKGPLALRLNLDFTIDSEFALDLQNYQSLNRFDLCQAVKIDNELGGTSFTLEVPVSGDRITAKAGTQGFYNIICPNPIKMVFKCAGGGRVTVFLINTAIPGSVWSCF